MRSDFTLLIIDARARLPSLIALLVALALGDASCAGSYHLRHAERPATQAELAQYPVSVPDTALAQALAAHGFRVVSRDPYQGDLLLTVRYEPTRAVAVLTSDGFFVEQLEAPLPLDATALAAELASSDRLADFVRNSGTVQQRDLTSQ